MKRLLYALLQFVFLAFVSVSSLLDKTNAT
ncbi:MAG: hypothetical protein KatS3mg087_2131 [Patescibacteria group bacterium]|nr:MAG: hypothetical protein KatS3mg087_2131 [Patescibacteria group bacterium]